MNKIDTALINDSIGKRQAFKGKSLAFLQNATYESLLALGRGMIGENFAANTVYVIYGCVLTGVSSGSGSYALTEGAVFYNGEVYLVDAVSTTTVGGGNTVYSDIVETFTDPADPCQFSNGTTANVHAIRKFKTSVLSTGSGTNPISGWIYRPYGKKVALTFVHAFIADTPTPYYRLYPNGDVKLFGYVKSTTVTSNIFSVLPAEARPKTGKNLLVYGLDEAVVYALIIDPNGEMYIQELTPGPIPNDSRFSLDQAATWNIND